MSILKIDKKLCSKDQLCIQDCPAQIIRTGQDGYPETDPAREEYCIQCGHCLAVCPCDALTLRGVSPKDCPPVPKEQIELDTLAGLIKSRRSVRSYKTKPIPAATLDKLFDLVRWAPTGGNQQPLKWLLIEKPEALKKIIGLTADWLRGNPQLSFIAEAWDAGQDLILRGAPQLAVAYAEPGYGSTQADCLIAVTTLELAATSQGLGACWAGYFMMACNGHPPLKEFLDLPPKHNVYAALMLGYPKYKYSRVPERKKLDLKKI